MLSQSVRKEFVEWFFSNRIRQTHLDLSHPTASFNADQMIQFARAVELEVSLASYGMLEDLVLKARVRGGNQLVGLRRSIGRSTFPRVAGSSWGDSVASRTNYSLPAVTESNSSKFVAVEGSLQEPRCSKVADARLAAGHASSDKPGRFRLKTVQEIKRSRKKNQSKTWKWSREGRQTPPLPTDCDKGGYVFTKELLELAPFAKTLPQDQMIPSVIDIVFFIVCSAKGTFRWGHAVCTNWIVILSEIASSEQKNDWGRRFVQATFEVVMVGCCMGLSWKLNRNCVWSYICGIYRTRDLFIMMFWKEIRLLYKDEARIHIQIKLLVIFLKSGGQHWALEEYWTQVGVATVQSVSIADFNWSHAHLSGINFGFATGLYWNFGTLSLGHFVGTRTIVCPSVLFWLGLRRMLCPCFDHMCLFQVLLHNCFVFLLKHIATILQREKVYSL